MMALADFPKTWPTEIVQELDKDYFIELRSFLSDELRRGKTLYPPQEDIFQAFKLVEFSNVKVIILGQDPYHGPDQAHGLSFSVRQGVRPPPSLVNIRKEIHRDLSLPIPVSGDLSSWARQGVLLLNTVLTVEQGRAGSHQGKGWERFTQKVLDVLSADPSPKVFMLWGSHAQKQLVHLTHSGHSILTAPHPSPLSAYRGFIGCGHFSKANDYLEQNNLAPIAWD
jgi:uracil-DNA glycosylase